MFNRTRKILLSFFSILFFGFIFNPSISFGALYDNFKKPTIDPKKWNSYEFVREIQDGKLISKVTAYGSRVKNELNFKNPAPINYIEADVRINKVEGNLGRSDTPNYSSPNARITGFFYNDGTASGPGSFKGEVQGIIRISPYNGKFWVYWYVWKSTNDEGTSWSTLAWNWFPDPVSLNTAYKLSIQFEPISRTFTFKVGSITRTWTTTDTIFPSNIPWKVIGTDVYFTGTGTDLYGKISATFDNVIARDVLGNVLVNDDFSSPWINPDNWSNYEFVREISGGRLWSELRSVNQNLWNTLPFKNPEKINDFQAKITLHDFQNPDGANTRARLGGLFYNDTGDGPIGDVFAEVALGGFGSTPMAFWNIARKDNIEGTAWIILASGEFPVPINLDETYTLFLGWDGITFTLKCKEAIANYTPTTPKYPPHDKTKALFTRIAPPSPEITSFSAFISATFDDVVINELA